MADLYVYEDDSGCCKMVAKSAEDARVVWCDSMGERVEDYLGNEFNRVPDDKVIRIKETDSPTSISRSMTARQWVKENGRGFLCTTEW